MKFSDFSLNELIAKGLDSAGYKNPTQVQEQTLKISLTGKDISVQSQTGTGKTAAFLISIFQLINSESKIQGKKALIIAPTRELAVQIEKEAQLLGKFLKIKTACIYGGVGYDKQERSIKNDPDIIIGTPGRLIDFLNTKRLDLRNVRMVVLDEADRLFDMGFLKDIRKLLRKTGDPKNRITMLFSATLDQNARTLAWEHMNSPEEVIINPEEVTVKKIEQELFHVSQFEKFSLLLGIIKKNNPSAAVIFTNTKQCAEEVAKRLVFNGYKARYIIGDLPQAARNRVLEEVKSGTLPFLVATDVAARGLHIEGLELVINYDLPEYCENYVHRIGRTARAGKSGKAVSLACERFVSSLEQIEEYTTAKIPVAWADDTFYAADKSDGKRWPELNKVYDIATKPPRPKKKTVIKKPYIKNTNQDLRNRKLPDSRQKKNESYRSKQAIKSSNNRQVINKVQKPKKLSLIGKIFGIFRKKKNK